MRQVVLINQSTNPLLTNDHILQACAAFAIQNLRDFQPHWDGQKDPSGNVIDGKATFSAAQADAGIPSDSIPAITQDEILDAPGDLAYHDQENGIGVCRMGLDVILQNGNSILNGPDSWACVSCHEDGVEVIGDWDANEWVLMPDGVTKIAFEHGDPVQTAYEIDVPSIGALPAGKVSVANFVLPSYYVAGSAGPWDFLGQLPGPFTVLSTGYQILMDGSGNVTNKFGAEMPQWKRDLVELKSRTPGTRHHKRHHGHKHGIVRCKPDGSVVAYSRFGTVTIDGTGIHITASSRSITEVA